MTETGKTDHGPAIELVGLEKKYGDFAAVRPIDFNVNRGEIFGFLGPNGAGKTTTLRMIMGILVPTGGLARIAGFDCHRDAVQVKRRVGYLPDQPVFYDYLRGREVLSFVAEMHGFTRELAETKALEILNSFGLYDAADEFAINYSLGMKKRLGLALAMIHEPEVLILDEPINGLDPRAAHDVQDRLQAFAAAGGTVLLSTHLLDMAEKICHRVAILDQGQLRALDTVENLRRKFGTDRSLVRSVHPLPESAPNSLEDLFLKLTE